jgi:hypothetical protein
MKVLHIWNQAGVSSIISKWQKKIGYESHVIVQGKHDPYHVGEYYNNETIYCGKVKFVLTALKRCAEYDIIHLHDAWFMIHLIKVRYPKKKIIMHYHGSMIRRSMKESRRVFWEKLVDKILVATPDLLDFVYNLPPIYIPNPVDVELFHNTPHELNHKCLFTPKKNQSKNGTQRLLRENGIDLELSTAISVPYKELPEVLRCFEYFCDLPIVNNEIIAANSMMGLQAMSIGLKTIQHDFSIKSELPPNHHPEFTVKLLDKIYKDVSL